MSDDERERKYLGRKILIAMDGGYSSTHAFQWYVKNIFKESDKVIVVYCAEKSNMSKTRGGDTVDSDSIMVDDHDDKVKKVFRQIEAIANRYKIRHILERLHPPVGEAVVKAARTHNVDLIIVGHRGHGHGLLKESVFESTSTYIAHHSNITVLVCTVDQPEEK